jgi:hypothetical protein
MLSRRIALTANRFVLLRGKIATWQHTIHCALALTRRPRRLRRTEAIRSLVRETR